MAEQPHQPITTPAQAMLAAELCRNGTAAIEAKDYSRMPWLIGSIGAGLELWRRGAILYLLETEPDWPWNHPPDAGH